MFGKSKYNFKLLLLATVMLTVTSVTHTVRAEGAEKDLDLDGLSDRAETEIYFTDPNNPDTDKDGILDYQEILDHTDPLDPNSNKLAEVKNAKLPLMWYLGRIAGIAAFVMFTLVLCMGLTMTSKISLKLPFIKAPVVLDFHQFTATFIALALTILHFVSFMFDDYILLKWNEIFVPFLLKRDLITAVGVNINIPVALGVIAFYLAIILVVTSQLRKKLVSVKLWRKIHYSSFLFYILFLVHGIAAGSDTNEPWMISIYASSAILVFGLVLLRIFGKKYFMPKPRASTTPPSNSDIQDKKEPLVEKTEPTIKSDQVTTLSHSLNTKILEPSASIKPALQKPQKFTAKVISNEYISKVDKELVLEIIEPSEFIFSAGQFISLNCNGGFRAYSIASSATNQKQLALVVAVGHEGLGSNYVKNLQINDQIEFIGPSGRFILPTTLKQNLIFIATGTGLAPLMSMLDQLEHIKSNATIKLYFGVRDMNELFKVDQLKILKTKLANFEYTICFSQPMDNMEENYFQGRVTDICSNDKLKNEDTQYFLCGNPYMIADMMNNLKNANVADTDIFHEKFTVSKPKTS